MREQNRGYVDRADALVRSSRMIIGISGASGIIYGIRALMALRNMGIESHLVVSPAAQLTREYETGLSRQQLNDLADVVYPINDVGAAISSGSFHTMGMLIAPCSVKSMAEIANGTCNSLLTRAADVCLKERRRLVMMVREAPLHLGHLRNMTAVTEMGAIIHPPVNAFYNQPQTIEDLVDYSLGRAFDCFGLDMPDMPRWDGTNRKGRASTPA